MDYLSLEVEGAEWEIMKDFPFDQYQWRFLTIERTRLELDLLLDLHGYIQVHHNNYDTFYIHKNFIEDANCLELNPKFLCTSRKSF